MMLRDSSWMFFVPIATAVLCAPAAAQDGAEFRKLEMRVIDSRPGSATLDRGGDDGLQPGDRVSFRHKDGRISYGTVNRIEERSSQVDLDDQSVVPAAGTRAEALVPNSRFVVPPAVILEPVPTPPPEPALPVEHPPWPVRDDTWREGEPLLARVRPLRPRERPSDVRGRLRGIFDFTHSTEDDRNDGFYRMGADVTVENRFGRGERMHFDGEWNYRHTDVPDNDDESKMRLRIDRASYAVGGNRFEPQRLEVGRFQQDNMPEFGVVDGAEWDRRLDGGDRIGLSAGFMPEPFADQDTGEDFQFAGSYRWVRDETEELSAAAGFQKSLHNGTADRDLLLTQVRYLPPGRWTASATAWIDYYGESDTNKGQGVELTQARVDSGRRFEDGSSLYFAYSHVAFPELDRDEFLPVTAAQLADDHNDRVSMQGRWSASRAIRFHALAAGWVDQDDSGGDGGCGIEIADAPWKSSLIDVSVFATEGKFVSLIGARASFVRTLDIGRLGGEYELTNNRIDGFSSNNNDLPQHRLRLFGEHYFPSGWSLAAHLETMLWDQEVSINLGFYLQKTF